MNFISSFYSLFLSSLVLGGFVSSTTFAAKVTTVTPIIVSPTGHKSCGKDEWGRKDSPFQLSLTKPVANLSDRLKKRYDGIEPRIIHACFDYEKLQFGGKLIFRYTLEGREFKTIRLGKWVLFEKIDWDYIEPVVQEFTDYISDVAREYENPVFYLVGHSWGGWLNLQVAQHLDEEFKIGAMVSLDPVSPLDCWPNLYVKLGLNYLKNMRANCHKAPSDITPKIQIEIMNRLNGNWRHYYQRQFLFIRSGPFVTLEEGKTMFHLEYEPKLFNFYHGDVQYEPAVWAFLQRKFEEQL